MTILNPITDLKFYVGRLEHLPNFEFMPLQLDGV
jgi:hypothetical protein